jgi:putative sugar O-methyltransferase
MTTKEPGMSYQILQKVETLRQSRAYQNYLQAREHVLAMMELLANQASNYWDEELEGFDYLFDASPLIVHKLREHSYHITGLRSYEYRQHHSHQQPRFAKKLAALREQDQRGVFIPESPEMGGFGHQIDGQIVNIDTLKFYEVLIALDKAGLLQHYLGAQPDRRVILEIGAGWGGFAYQFKKLCPQVTYIIVDLPPTILFSATYLTAVFPDARVAYGDELNLNEPRDFSEYDFVFLPHYAFDQLSVPDLHLAINMVSFQEMTTEQVQGYVLHLYEMGCSYLYSLNRDRSRHNNQLTTVSSIMGRYYTLQPVEVLDIPYTMLEPKSVSTQSVRQRVKRLLGWFKMSRDKPLGIYDYRHLVGERKTK